MTQKKIKVTPFDAARYLRDEEDLAAYLAVALEEDGPEGFLAALGTAARAKGMTQLAKETGLGRESLYKTLSPGSNPRFETIVKITKALGVPLTITAPHQDAH